jgi:nickel and cobalt resistance protein CnrR
MKPATKAVVFCVAIAISAAIGCLLAGAWARSNAEGEDFHEWAHEQLGLTEDQERQIEPAEARFQQQRAALMKEIQQANAELAKAMLSTRGASAEVDAAIEKTHHAQAKLQRATIQHVFEMKDALQPDQYEKLLKLTSDALADPSH